MIKQLMKIFLLSLLSFNIIASGVIISTESVPENMSNDGSTTKVYIEPQNGTAVVGGLYNITVKIANVTDLFAFNIMLRWGTAVLKHVSHTVTVGVAGGVLEAPVMTLKDIVDETASTPNAVGSTYWIGCTSLNMISTFNGTGTVFNMTFRVLRDGECDIYFTYTDLTTPVPNAIAHVAEDGYFYRPNLGEVPEASFTFYGGRKPGTAVENKNTVFNASSSDDPEGNIVLYIWNFGDGTIENTTDPIATHNYTVARGNPYIVELTVLDDQGTDPKGSQSKPIHQEVLVVQPNPEAEFTIWPEIAVINKTVTFDASASYDPDPEGNIVKYMWDFGDGTAENTTNPITNHTYTSFFQGKPGTEYTVILTVEDDESLEGNATEYVIVVERRDVEVTSAAFSPNELTRGDIITINATVTNRGSANETFYVRAYYNVSSTEWEELNKTGVLPLLVEDFAAQNSTLSAKDICEPLKWQLTARDSTNNTVNSMLINKLGADYWIVSNDTKVRVGSYTGYWTINPSELNDATNSSSSIAGTPLTTGGWLLEQDVLGPKIVKGEFSAGNWTFVVRLYANETGVTATIWVRILKSSSPNPHDGVTVTVLKDWTALFPARPLKNYTEVLSGTIQMPAMTFIDEYLYVEYQLQVTGNSAGSATEVIFQTGTKVGAPLDGRPQILPTTFSDQEHYTFSLDTEPVPPGNHTFMIAVSEVPHETNVTNNAKYSSNVRVFAHTPIAKFSFTPVTPYPDEMVTFDGSTTYVDRFLNITSYVWDFGDGANTTGTSPITTHTFNATGNYNVTLTITDSYNQTDSKSQQITVEVEYVPLDVKITVCPIYFKGETAEFYVLISRSGGRINASEITAFIIFNQTLSMLDSTQIKLIAAGVYLMSFDIPANASPGTYTLVVDANYFIPPNIILQGTALESFTISPTLTNWDTSWNAKLISINGTLVTVNSTLGLIQADVSTIKARLIAIEGTLVTVNSTLGLIQADASTINATLVGIHGTVGVINSTLGTLETHLSTINATITDVAGYVFSINTTLGEVQTSVGGIQSTMTIGLAAASILSAIAAAVAILILLFIRKHGA